MRDGAAQLSGAWGDGAHVPTQAATAVVAKLDREGEEEEEACGEVRRGCTAQQGVATQCPCTYRSNKVL